MQANVKTKNSKKLKVKVLVDFGCTHIGINEQLVKNKKIQTKPINFSFEVFNVDGTKNREVTKVASLEIEINRYKETLEAAITDLHRFLVQSTEFLTLLFSVFLEISAHIIIYISICLHMLHDFINHNTTYIMDLLVFFL